MAACVECGGKFDGQVEKICPHCKGKGISPTPAVVKAKSESNK